MDTKLCSKCGKNKKFNYFYKSKATKDGLTGYCKSCSREYSRAWSAKNKYYHAFKSNVTRARERGLPSDWTYEQMAEALEYFGGCALTGDKEDISWDHVIPLEAGFGGTTERNMIPMKRSLNSSKGFGNLVSWHDWAVDVYGIEPRKLDELLIYLSRKNNMSVKEYKEYISFNSVKIWDRWRESISTSKLQ